MATISPVNVMNLAEKILESYAERGFSEFELGERQYYHAVASDEMYDMARTPTDLVVGDLDDDLAELMKLTGEDAMPTAVDMERLGRVLIAISEAVTD